MMFSKHLTKQVDLLRQVNDQHAKVYEQLDVAARELEESNRKLTQDNRMSQQKIHGLTEMVELLQTQMEELQHQVDDMKLGPSLLAQGRWRTRGAQSVSCLEELQRHPEEPSNDLECYGVQQWHEEQQASLQRSLRSLQAHYAGERTRREEAELQAGFLSRENMALEQQLAGMETCKVRVSELEKEAEELHHLWKSQTLARCDLLLLHPEEEGEEEESLRSRRPLKRWASEHLLKGTRMHETTAEHECWCARRAEVVKHRGISLLNEVDAQYSALQVKYNELLQRLSQTHHLDDDDEEGVIHKGVQTTSLGSEDDVHQPEYKELFREIFSRIHKTKEDLIKNRVRSPAGREVSLHPQYLDPYPDLGSNTFS
uniref:cerebellar degeneration-related protein 2-like isoform X2 n=1 Tax=Doryrhamphus excisus TaxID=161450 RepID=UPI0025AEA1F9|nr:cerebellar degeneration-related protein 2-like isoform X2 [Doryrhamphus excisus]